MFMPKAAGTRLFEDAKGGDSRLYTKWLYNEKTEILKILRNENAAKQKNKI